MRLKTTILFCLIVLIGSGCGSAKKSVIYVDDSRRVIPVMPGDTLTTMAGETIIDFRGVIIPRGRYFYLVRCENVVIQEGILP